MLNHALYSLVMAATDSRVGGSLCQQVLAPLGIVLLVAGSFVMRRIVDEVLSRGGSLSRRHFPSGFIIMDGDICPAT